MSRLIPHNGRAGHICLRALAGFNQKNGKLDSFFLVFWWWFAVVCALWWFACIVSGFTTYVPNSGGDLWWFAVMCGGFGFFPVVCGNLW